jgi:acetyltransferase-like isoleucine patch superfamily enzyme
MITMAHEIDCSDRVEIGDYSSLAGFRCTVLTHSLNLVRDRFVTGPVEIGAHAAVMSGSTLLSGTRVPPRTVVSAHSVVNTPLSDELTFYSGNPAVAVRSLPETLGFFHRGEDGMPAAGGDPGDPLRGLSREALAGEA